MKFDGSPTEFEFAIKSLCESMGFTVQLTQPSHDGGVDHVVFDPTPIRGGRYIIQAKRYEGGVGEPVIRDLYGTLLHSGAVKAILITTGHFTDAASAFAKGKPIELVDGDALEKLVEQAQLNGVFLGNSALPSSVAPPLVIWEMAEQMVRHNDKSLAALFFKGNLTSVLADARPRRCLIDFCCGNLEDKDALLLLEYLLLNHRSGLSNRHSTQIRNAVFCHCEKAGFSDKAIQTYSLTINPSDKEQVSLYLYSVRSHRGNPTAYREALRLLSENGETGATLNGIAGECYWNGLWEDQIRYLKKAIAMVPSDAEMCKDMAFAYEMLDQKEAASYWNKKAVLLFGE